MRKLTILKACIDLAYFFGIITMLAMAIFVPMLIIGDDAFPVTVRGQEIPMDRWPTKLLMVFVALGAVAFFYGIFLLRRTLVFFSKRDVFNLAVITNFNRIGWCIVASALLTSVPLFIYNAAMRTDLGFEISAGLGFDSFMMSIALGLLFMVIGEAFRMAKNIKEESELTI